MILMNLRRRLGALAATALLVPVALTACSTEGGTSADGGGRLQVLASFYPLQFVAEQVGADLVDVKNLTPPAADPHDLELSLASARQLRTADVVIYLSGFQAAVDTAVEQNSPDLVVDAADHVDLLQASVTGGEEEHDHAEDAAAEEEHDHAEDEHAEEAPADEEHADEEGHDHDMGGYDPHFWLDPLRLAKLAEPVADAFAQADPGNAETFQANAADLVDRLNALDAEFQEALAPFAGATLITNHTAFGYLAQRYGLEQVGITGLDHDVEASPARLREIGQIAEQHGVTTLFSETLVSPAVVDTLASDLGLRTAVLDTLEGLNQSEIDAGNDYISVMQANIQTLTEGLTTP